MSVATTKDLQTHLRFTLVRVTAARSMTASLALSAGVYQCAWTRPVSQVQRNGVALTKDTAIPVSNDHYWFDETNSLFYVKVASAPSDTTNVICLFYYLFTTTGMARIANEDPLDTSTPLRQWEPRLLSEPRFRQSVRNTIVGVFTLDGPTIELANADNYYNQWLTNDDSLSMKDLSAWVGLAPDEATAADYQRVFNGTTRAAILGRQSLSLTVLDPFARFNQPALMGDNGGECYFRRDSTSYPSVDPAFLNRPVPLHFGRFSYYQTKALFSWSNYKQMDPQTMPAAACTSYSTNVSTSVNRTWTLCRVSPDGLGSCTVAGPTLTSVSNNGNSLILTYSGGGVNALDLYVGDMVQISQSALATHYGRVARLDNTDIYIIHDAPTTVAYTTSVVITPLTAPSLVIHDSVTGCDYFPCPTVDYTWSTTTTTGGNKLVAIVFVNNFEGRGLFPFDQGGTTQMVTLDPSRHTVHYRVRSVLTNYGNQADVLKYMCTAAGLTPATASFTTAKSSLAVNAQFCLPYFDENDYRAYVDYVGDFLESTLALLAIDGSFQVQYLLLAAPSSADSTDDNTAVRDSDSVTIEYQDVVTGMNAYNPHNAAQAAVDATTTPNETRSSTKAQYLHGIVNVMQFRHLLETITARIDNLLAARSSRRATYTFDVTSKYLDATLGQDLLRGGSLLLGADTSRAVKIITLDRAADKTSVGAVDLLGVT